MKRKLWLRFNGIQEYLEKEQKILSILEEFEAVKGDCVLIYNSNTRAVKTLKVNVEITEELLQRLTEFLDSESVKVAEKEDYDNLSNEWMDAPGYTMKENLEFMKIKRLDRIADALEGIDQSLDCISSRLLDISLGMDQ
ncbi:hypothetical protein HMPREF1216_01463 [Coprococcus sp. HPP0048]|nr:hypothetical protein HMPREF1216_01463 [Coprococcus sp. HPP0048]